MIQLIALRPVIKTDGTESKKQKRLGNAPSVAELFANIDSYIQAIPQQERWNVYYTAAQCKKYTNGKLRVFKEQHIIPFDIDKMDASKLSNEQLKVYIDLFFEMTGLDRKKTGVLFSGNGLHFLVQTPEPFTKEKYFKDKRLLYRAICTRYNAMLAKKNLPGDMDVSVWSGARILRMPNTENRKSKGTTRAYLIQSTIVPQAFDWQKIAGIEHVPEEAQLNGWIEKNNILVDKKYISKACGFIKWVNENPKEVREPHFYAASTIIGRMEDGPTDLHKLAENIRLSGNDSSVGGYSVGEIDEKINAAIQITRPRTCKGIETLWDGCPKCPQYKARIKSPISLKSEGFLATQKNGFYGVTKSGKLTPAYSDLIKFFEQKYHYKVTEVGHVYLFDGTHYELCSKVKIGALASKHFDPTPSAAIVKEFRERLVHKNVVEAEFFETQPGFINCKNGVVDIKKGELFPHSPSYGFRYCLDYDYKPEAHAPEFEAFLSDIMEGDQEKISILEEFGGFALGGGPYKYHKFLLLSGSGRNGKGTFVELLRKVAGINNVSDVAMKDMKDINIKQLMEGKLFNFSDELNTRDFKDLGELKKMTGDGTIMVKQMWSQPYQIKAQTKLIFACNEQPALSETTTAIRQRLLLIEFNKEFTHEKGNIDHRLGEKLEEELPGILNVLMRGYNRLEKQGGFTECKQMLQDVESYLEMNNPVLEWIKESEDSLEIKLLNGKQTFSSSKELYDLFTEWYMGKGRDISMRAFVNQFAQVITSGKKRQGRGYNSERKQVRGFFDVEIKGSAAQL